MTENTKRRRWEVPIIRHHGTFESATQYCDKQLGGSDGFTFMGQSIECSTATASA